MYELRQSVLEIVIVSKSQTIVSVSDNCLNMLGYLTNELIGKKLTILMDERKARVHQMHVDSYVDNGRVRADVGKFPAIRKDGTKKDVYVWIQNKNHFEVSGVNLVAGLLFDAEIVDQHNSLTERQNRMLTMGNKFLERIEDIHNDLKQVMVANKIIDDKGIYINVEGGKSSQDTNINSSGDTNIRDINN